MVFAIPFDLVGPTLDWAFEHAPAVTAVILFVVFAVWLAIWVSGYATRFKHVEADVRLCRQPALKIQGPGECRIASLVCGCGRVV